MNPGKTETKAKLARPPATGLRGRRRWSHRRFLFDEQKAAADNCGRRTGNSLIRSRESGSNEITVEEKRVRDKGTLLALAPLLTPSKFWVPVRLAEMGGMPWRKGEKVVMKAALAFVNLGIAGTKKRTAKE